MEIDGEKMARLLLSGAKMTNKHCEKCYFPLFEKDGKLFCVNCSTQEKEDKKAVEFVSTESKDVVDQKIAFLYNKLQTADTVEEIEKIGRAILTLKKIKPR